MVDEKPIWEWTWQEVQEFIAEGGRLTVSAKFWEDNPELDR